MKNYLDNTKQEFTEANMFEFALNYMERFQYDLIAKGILDPIKVDKFLSENIEKFKSKSVLSVTSDSKERESEVTLLKKYSEFLESSGYLDSDWWQEEPTAINEFYKQ